jgi:hypothetical protein
MRKLCEVEMIAPKRRLLNHNETPRKNGFGRHRIKAAILEVWLPSERVSVILGLQIKFDRCARRLLATRVSREE